MASAKVVPLLCTTILLLAVLIPVDSSAAAKGVVPKEAQDHQVKNREEEYNNVKSLAGRAFRGEFGGGFPRGRGFFGRGRGSGRGLPFPGERPTPRTDPFGNCIVCCGNMFNGHCTVCC